VTDVVINSTKSSVLPVLCTRALAAKPAHPSTVGFVAVQPAARGGLLNPQPRFTQFDVRIQLTNGAYGISGSAAQGSPMTEAAVPAVATARGVPPRGRPV
jgi:hypothetical protein